MAAGALGAAAIGYAAFAALCVRRYARQDRGAPAFAPPVTVLKPLYGAEPELYECLRGFFTQDYPDYQIVFGVSDPGDPARAVAERLMAEFPGRDATMVVSSRVNGRNPKISNLINMLGAARHDMLAISDADIAVGTDYLARVVAPLAERQVGAVTCPYTARAAHPRLAARLACMHINDWFLPSVLVARALGQVQFCMGSTMAVRRDSLAAIGGLAALRDELADDYMLGRRLVAHGYRVVLADRLVETVVSETTLSAVARHELRWARTIRGVEPAKYAASMLENTVSVAALAALGPAGRRRRRCGRRGDAGRRDCRPPRPAQLRPRPAGHPRPALRPGGAARRDVAGAIGRRAFSAAAWCGATAASPPTGAAP